MRQAIKAAFLADGFNRKVETSQQTLGVFDSHLNEIITETHPNFGPEQIREIPRAQVDHLCHLVSVNVLAVVSQYKATCVFGSVVLKVVRGVHRVSILINEDDVWQIFIPEFSIRRSDKRVGIHRLSTNAHVGVSVGVNHALAKGRVGHAIQELGHKMCRFYHVGFLCHQYRCIRNRLVSGENAPQRIRRLSRVDENEAGGSQNIR